MKPTLFLLSIILLFPQRIGAQTAAGEDATVVPLRVGQTLFLYTSPEDGFMRSTGTVPPGDSIVASQYFRHKRQGYWKLYYAGEPGYVFDNSISIRGAVDTNDIGEETRDALQGGKERVREARDAAAARLSLVYARRKEERRLAAIEQKRLADSVAARQAFVADSTRRERKRIEDSTRVAVQLAEQRQAEIDDSIKVITDAAQLATAIQNLRTQFGPYGLMISEWSWGYGSEYSSAADFSVRIYNPTRKRIKYVHFSLTATDPVGTRLKSFGRSSVVTVKGIGPIEPDEFGSWEFENVFWSNVIETMRIASIKVEYMDGSVKVIAQPSKIDMSD